MTDDGTAPVWHTPTLEEFKEVNPILHNHSSMVVLDPELEVATNPPLHEINE